MAFSHYGKEFCVKTIADTSGHNDTQADGEIRITERSTKADRLHPVFDAKGRRVRKVYFRVLSDGNKTYYARVVDPKRGKETYQSSPDGSMKLAMDLVVQSKKAVGDVRADAYHEALAAIRRRTDGWTIGDVLAAYPQVAAEQRAATGSPSVGSQTVCIGRARRVFKGHEGEPVGRAPDILYAHAVAYNAAHGGKPTTTAASEAQQVRSLFSSWALDAYERMGMERVELRWRRIAKPDFQYELPDRELRERTIAVGKEELAKGTPIGRAFLLEFFCAMSAADAALARWDWLGADGVVRYRRHKTAKAAEPRLAPEVAARWRELAAQDGAGDFVMEGRTEGARHRFLLHELADWMTELGWETEKKGHELRKLMCSIWYTTPGIGAEWTQAWSGDSLEVLQKHYARLLPERAPAAPSV